MEASYLSYQSYHHDRDKRQKNRLSNQHGLKISRRGAEEAWPEKGFQSSKRSIIRYRKEDHVQRFLVALEENSSLVELWNERGS